MEYKTLHILVIVGIEQHLQVKRHSATRQASGLNVPSVARESDMRVKLAQFRERPLIGENLSIKKRFIVLRLTYAHIIILITIKHGSIYLTTILM